MTQIPIKKALFWIWGSTIVVSGGVSLFLSLKQKWDHEIHRHQRFNIQTIVQKCSSAEPLSTDYLAECLELSIDAPTNIFASSSDEMEEALMLSPLIKSVLVSKILPSTLMIEYSLRQPVAILYDYQNTVVDDEGVLFPLQPFKTPKKTSGNSSG